MRSTDRRGVSWFHGARACELVPRVLCVLAVLTVVAVPLGFAPSALAAETGQVAGTATDAVTQAGIEGLEVCARLRSERSGGHCARTGQNGEYTIQEVPAGSYIVEFSVPFRGGPGSSQDDLDYAPQYYDGKTAPAEAEEVTVMVEETTRGIDAAMAPGGKITGVVTDAVTHDQVAGVEVCAYRPLEYEPSRCGLTNADGEYTIDPLVGGEYVVVFTAPSDGPLDYAPQYYRDQTSGEQANKVPVTMGETTSGIDAAMQAGGGIAGQVTVAATGSPLMNAYVCVFSLVALSAGDEGPERCVQTNANGEYILPQLAAGQDVVEFHDEFGAGFVRQYYDGKSSRAEATPLSVTPGVTITGVDAALHAVGEETVKLPGTETLTAGLPATTALLRAAPLIRLMGSELHGVQRHDSGACGLQSGGLSGLDRACRAGCDQAPCGQVRGRAQRNAGARHRLVLVGSGHGRGRLAAPNARRQAEARPRAPSPDRRQADPGRHEREDSDQVGPGRVRSVADVFDPHTGGRPSASAGNDRRSAARPRADRDVRGPAADRRAGAGCQALHADHGSRLASNIPRAVHLSSARGRVLLRVCVFAIVVAQERRSIAKGSDRGVRRVDVRTGAAPSLRQTIVVLGMRDVTLTRSVRRSYVSIESGV